MQAFSIQQNLIWQKSKKFKNPKFGFVPPIFLVFLFNNRNKWDKIKTSKLKFVQVITPSGIKFS